MSNLSSYNKKRIGTAARDVCNGVPGASDRLAAEVKPLVERFVWRYRHYYHFLDREDFEQYAYAGVFDALRHFNPAHPRVAPAANPWDVFVDYAIYRIKSQCHHAIRDHAWRSGEDIDPELVGPRPGNIVERRPWDAGKPDDRQYGGNPATIAEDTEEFNWYMRLLHRHLDPRSVMVICLRYGLTDGIGRSRDDVAKELTARGERTVSRERVRQIEEKALDRIRPYVDMPEHFLCLPAKMKNMPATSYSRSVQECSA